MSSLLLYPPNFVSPHHFETFRFGHISCSSQPRNVGLSRAQKAQKWAATTAFIGGSVGVALLGVVGPAIAATEIGVPLLGSSVVFSEPSNALSLPTWAVHVSSVAEWITAMALVWHYGDRTGNETWKGLSWGMVPLLGGAMCACTWHFFYNAESLEVLVALQAALTVMGNITMCIAAFRIYRSQSPSQNS